MRGINVDRGKLDAAGWSVLTVQGEVDLATAPELERVVKSVLEDEDSDLLIDLTETSFMDSTGLRVLILADREFGDLDRRVAILVGPGPISRLLDVSGLRELLLIVEDPAELPA